MATTIIKSAISNNQAIVTDDGELLVTGNLTTNNSSVGPSGDPAPADATLVAGIDPDGNLAPVKVDSTGAVIVTSDGTAQIQDVKVVFLDTASISVGIETSINSYIAPAGKKTYLLGIFNAGENRAQYNLYKDGVLFDRQYTNVTQLSAPFDYKTGSNTAPGYEILSGETVEVKVINAGTSTASFNSRILILEVQ